MFLIRKEQIRIRRGHFSLIWPRKDLYEGFCLLSLEKMTRIKSYFQNKNCEITKVYDEIEDKEKLQQLDERIKPYLFCERWFPFAQYCDSVYLMLDYNPSDKGQAGQIICFVHDPDFVYYIASNITEVLQMTEEVIDGLVYE